MAHPRKATGTLHLTLFDSQYQHAVADMVAQFQQQLTEATTPEERRELETAIRSWTEAHEQPHPSTPAASKRSRRSSNPTPRI